MPDNDFPDGFITPSNFTLTAHPKNKLIDVNAEPDGTLTEIQKFQVTWRTVGLERAVEAFDKKNSTDPIVGYLIDSLQSTIKTLRERLNEI